MKNIIGFSFAAAFLLDGCSSRSSTFDPHAGIEYPPLEVSIDVSQLSHEGVLHLTGSVFSEKNEPLPGAVIRLGRRGDKYTVADSVGGFEINLVGVSANDTLIFYYAGFETLIQPIFELVDTTQ